mgnify:CR=1 FL=1
MAVAVTAVKSQVQAVVAVPVVVAPSNAFILASKSSKVEKNSSMIPEPHWKTSPPTPMTPRTMEITRYLQKKNKHIYCTATYVEFGSESISNYLLKEILGILDESADVLIKNSVVNGHSDQKNKNERKQNSDQESSCREKGRMHNKF